MYCGSTECNVFVCANVHVHSQGFHYILSVDGWMAFCSLVVSLLHCFFFFFSSVHITRHAVYRSLPGTVLITC